MSNSDTKYFLAIVPPEPILSEVMALKEYFSEHHKSKGALRSPGHITLHMPFNWPDKKRDKLRDALADFAGNQKPVAIKLKDFNCFAPRVIFIDVEHSDELLELQKKSDRFFKTELNVFSAAYRDLPFHPHMTVAFRDLKKNEFAAAWSLFENKKFEASFTADSIALLQHDGLKWNVLENFKLGKTES
jgi:2'-5' RNA ligase